LLRQREKNAYDSYIGPDKQFAQVMLEQAQRQQNPYLDVDARGCRWSQGSSTNAKTKWTTIFSKEKFTCILR
jgi:hypothetical protein